MLHVCVTNCVELIKVMLKDGCVCTAQCRSSIWILVSGLKFFTFLLLFLCIFSDAFSASSSQVGEIASGQPLASWLEILQYCKPLLVGACFQTQGRNRMMLVGGKSGTVSSAVKCLRNKIMDIVGVMFMVFFSGTFWLITKTSYGEVELNDNYCFTSTYCTLDCIAWFLFR